ncbi:hypothetical protein HNR23_004131 [Nocardiopsis mwathae]|uniref:Uncharacterized protein n=1 Tax=Nocardiopsis mwathae TaxID=1472723 RepID=A0A7W9YN00_9ACTN|nr:hypothetical protein [Nocardiopsis mwathae]MBB6174071.1 hypothetical protein [Nocardiopsis mwathae]
MLQRAPAHLEPVFIQARERASASGYTLTWYRTPDGWRYILTNPTTGFKRTYRYLAQVQQRLHRADAR